MLSGDALGQPHPDYGPVRFAETTFHALPLDAAETGVPDLAAVHVGDNITYLNESEIRGKIRTGEESEERLLRWAIQDVLAHEYAHHILESNEESSEHGALFTELKELTADCRR